MRHVFLKLVTVTQISFYDLWSPRWLGGGPGEALLTSAHGGSSYWQGVWAVLRVSQLRDWKTCGLLEALDSGQVTALSAVCSARTGPKAMNRAHPVGSH